MGEIGKKIPVGKGLKALFGGTTAAGAVGFTALQADEALRGENSILGRAKQNEASSNAAAGSQGFWASLKEGFANFLELIETFFPKANFSGLKNRLRENIHRPGQETLPSAVLRAVGDDPTNAAIALAAPGAGLLAGSLLFLKGKDHNGNNGGNNRVTLGHDTGGSGGSTPGGNGGGDAPRGGNGGGNASQKAASGAGIEAAETGAKHSRGGKLGLAAAVGLGGYGIYETVIKPTSAGAAELDKPTTAPATLAAPNLSTSENLMLGAMTADAAYGVSKGASLVAKEGLEFAGKRIPIVGGVLTMAFTTVAAAGYAMHGEFGRAGAELATGTVEAALNTTGLGLLGAGDAAREALRAGIGTVAGEGYTPDKSGLRTVYEYATGTGDFNAAAAPTQTASVGQLKDAVANSEIRTAEVSLDGGLSSDFASSAMMPVPAPSGGGIDLSSMDNNKNRKSKHPSLDATIG